MPILRGERMIEVRENLLKILPDALWRKIPEHTYSEQEWQNILFNAFRIPIRH